MAVPGASLYENLMFVHVLAAMRWLGPATILVAGLAAVWDTTIKP